MIHSSHQSGHPASRATWCPPPALLRLRKLIGKPICDSNTNIILTVFCHEPRQRNLRHRYAALLGHLLDAARESDKQCDSNSPDILIHDVLGPSADAEVRRRGDVVGGLAQSRRRSAVGLRRPGESAAREGGPRYCANTEVLR